MHGSVAFAETKTIGRRLTSLPSFAALLTLGTGMSIQFLTLLTGAMSARLLGVEGRGEFAAVTLLPLLVVALGDLGGPIAYTYLSAEDPSRAPALARNALAITAVLGTLLVGMSGVATTLYLHAYPHLIRISMVYGAAMIPIFLLGKHLNALAQGTGRFISFNVARLMISVFYLVGVLVLMLLDMPSIPLVLAGWTFGGLIYLVIATLPWRFDFRKRPIVDMNLVKATYSYGLRAQLGTISPIDSYRLDLVLVVLFLDAYEAGLYAVAVATAMAIRTQATTLGLVAVPSTVRQPERNAKYRTAYRFLFVTTTLTVVMGTAIGFSAEPLIELVYGEDFGAAAPTARLLIGAMVVASLRQAVGDMLRAFNAPGISSIAEVSSWFCVALLLPFLTARHGLTGAALGVLISYCFALLVTIVMGRSILLGRSAPTEAAH